MQTPLQFHFVMVRRALFINKIVEIKRIDKIILYYFSQWRDVIVAVKLLYHIRTHLLLHHLLRVLIIKLHGIPRVAFPQLALRLVRRVGSQLLLLRLHLFI